MGHTEDNRKSFVTSLWSAACEAVDASARGGDDQTIRDCIPVLFALAGALSDGDAERVNRIRQAVEAAVK